MTTPRMGVSLRNRQRAFHNPDTDEFYQALHNKTAVPTEKSERRFLLCLIQTGMSGF